MFNAFDKDGYNKKVYEKIKTLYNNKECRTLNECFETINLKRHIYYYICKKYKLPYIIEKKNLKNQSGGANKLKSITVKLISIDNNNEKINNIVHNDNNMSTNNNKIDELKKYNNIKLISNNDTNYSKNNNIMSDNNIIFTQNKNLNDNNKKNINEQKEKKHKQLCIKYINDIYNSKIVNSHQ